MSYRQMREIEMHAFLLVFINENHAFLSLAFESWKSCIHSLLQKEVKGSEPRGYVKGQKTKITNKILDP